MSEKRSRTKSNTTLLDLSPDVLILILSQFDHTERLSLSLVSKSFRSLIDRFVHKLYFFNRLPSRSEFTKLFVRFSSAGRIVIGSKIFEAALTLIAESGVKIECLEFENIPKFIKSLHVRRFSGRLGGIKGLKFESCIGSLGVAEFVRLFHSLEVLDLSCLGGSSWNDVGIKMVAMNCRSLRKVKLNYILSVTARSLDALASYCVNLEYISFKSCLGISFPGVFDFLKKAKNLKFLDLPTYLFSRDQLPHLSTLANTKPVCGNLSHLSIDGVLLKDDYLLVIAGIQAPLTRLELKLVPVQHPSYTMNGLSAILRAFPRLTKLDLHLPWPGSDDQDMELGILIKSLTRLKEVCFVSWSPVCSTLLFSLINNCSFLESIYIKSMDRYTRWDMPEGIQKNHIIQRIDIDPWPKTLSLATLKSLCPSFKKLSM